jgi:hypothetical protein
MDASSEWRWRSTVAARGQRRFDGGAASTGGCGGALSVREARQSTEKNSCGGCGTAWLRRAMATVARVAAAVEGEGTTAHALLRRSSGCGGVARLLEETRRRPRECGAREDAEAWQSTGLGLV